MSLRRLRWALVSTTMLTSSLQAQQVDTLQLRSSRDSLLAIRKALADLQQSSQVLAVKAEPLARLAERTPDASLSQSSRNQIDDTRDQLELKRAEAYSVADRLLLQQAIGAKAMLTTILAYCTGQSLGLTASPFVSPTFTAKFDRIRQFQWAPALVGAIGTLVTKNPSAAKNWAAAGLVTSVSLGDVLQFLGRKADRGPYTQAVGQLNSAYSNYQQMLDLLAFNRGAYDDALRFEARMRQVAQHDTSLWKDMEAFRQRPEIVSLRAQVDYRASSAMPGYESFVDSTKVYFERFERFRSEVDHVWQELGATTKSYKTNKIFLEADGYAQATPATGEVPKINQFARDTKAQITKLDSSFAQFSTEWQQLQKAYFLISPAEAQQINSFYLATELIARLTR